MPTPPAATPYTKFKFDTEFMEGSLSGALSTRMPSKTQEEVRQEAYNAGFAAGVEEGRKQATTEVESLGQMVQGMLTSLQNALGEREKQLVSNSLSLLRVTLHHLLGHAATHYPDVLLEQHLRAIQPLIKHEDSLILHIHPGAQGFHEKLNLPQAQILGLQMQIVPDSTLALTDVVVEWKGGGVESKLANHWEALSALLAGAGATTFPVPNFPEGAAQPTAQPTPENTATPTAPETPMRARAAELLGDEELIDALK